MRISAWLFLLAPLAGCTAQHTTPAPIPKPQALAAAVQKFLDDKGAGAGVRLKRTAPGETISLENLNAENDS